MFAAGLRTGWLVLFCCFANAVASASEERLAFVLSSGQDIEIERFAGEGAARLLWLPTERGFGDAHRQHARALARLGHEVWLVDLHDIYFQQPGRASISRFPLDDVVEVIQLATQQAEQGLILVSGSRGAQLALVGAREWQLQNPGSRNIRGVILAHAHLYEARPGPGESATYLPVVQATNLPVYLLAAQYSTKSSRIAELAAELGGGGSSVYTQVLPGLQGGFHLRDDALLSAREIDAKNDWAATLSRAATMLKMTTPPDIAVASELDTRRFSSTTRSEPVLAALEPPVTAPPLRLEGFDGASYSLEEQGGRLVLVNFWASWCKPCVREIPSLQRLAGSFEDSAFDVVTVNVGEDRERIAAFLQRVPVELPLLMDYDAGAAADWMIYVYPSSYLVDGQGKIRYAYLGALEWDSTQNIEIIRSLLRRQ